MRIEKTQKAVLNSNPSMCLGIFLLLLIFSPDLAAGKALKVHFINVGYGDAALIETPSKHAILIDAGNLSSAYKVKRYLEKQNISVLDRILITHFHPDHAGGLFCLLTEFNTRMVSDNGSALAGNILWEQYIALVENTGVQRETLKGGQSISYGGVTMDVLSPSKTPGEDLNAGSVVVRMRHEKVAFLLAADMTKGGEAVLLKKGLDLRSGMLKVGHHGACDATSEAFLDKIDPSIAVISVGKNSFGNPCEETLHVLKARGIRIFRTDVHGTIVLHSDGQSISVSTDSGF